MTSARVTSARVTSARVGIVAGSGLALHQLLDDVTATIPFTSMPDPLPCSVSGHAGELVFGRCGGVPLVVQLGRLHIYEGLPYAAVTATVDALHSFGVRRVMFTNAAGGLRPDLVSGMIMAITRVALWPCRRWTLNPPEVAPTFTVAGCDAEGEYVWVHGPSYETRAEIAAMQRLNYAAVGMSTAPEMARAHELGMETAAISCITNACDVVQKLTHEHVIETARHASSKLCAILRTAILD